jgi:hypothetical protein
METTTTRTLGRQATRIFSILGIAVILAAGLIVAPATGSDAEAHHGGLMTIRGTASSVKNDGNWGSPQAGTKITLYRWDGYWVSMGSVTTDRYGNFAIVAARGHYYYLSGYLTIGRCGQGGMSVFHGNTNWFDLSNNTSNPFRIWVPLYYQGYACY